MSSKNILSILACIASITAVTYGQDPRIVTYGIEEGLGRPDVACIYQDTRGALWVGTKGAGLYQFNAGRFMQSRLAPQSIGYRIRQIEEDADGYLYILSERGLYKYDGRNAEAISPRHSPVLNFTTTGAGIWWLTADSLFLRRPDERIPGLPISALHLVPKCPGACGVLAVSHNKITSVDNRFRIREAIELNQSREWIAHESDATGQTWIVSKEGWLLRDNGLGYVQQNTGLQNVTDIEAGALGSLWMSSSAGVSIYQPMDSLLISLPIKTPLNSVHFDRSNRLWLGSASEGLIRYFGDQHRIHRIPDPNRIIRLYSGATTNDVFVLTAENMFPLTNPAAVIGPPVEGARVRQYFRDEQYRIWAISSGELWMYYDTVWTKMDSVLSATHQIIGSDRSGNIWVSEGDKLFRYRLGPSSVGVGVRFGSSEISGKRSSDRDVAFFSMQDGDVLRVGRRSLGMISGESYELLDEFEFNVLSADVDSSVLWLGTEAEGIFRKDLKSEDPPVALHSTYPLRALDVHFIRQVGDHLIVGTDRSLLRMYLAPGGVRALKVHVLDQQAGISFMHREADDFAMTTDNHLLLNTGNEILEFDLSHETAQYVHPMISINGIQINGIPIDETEYGRILGAFFSQKRAPEMNASENNIVFSFSGNSIENEILLYSWRLSGADTTWSEPSPVAEAQFAGLSPGRYVLEARVCDASGNCSELRAPWRFSISKALWQHVWFLGLISILILTLGIWWYLRRREQQRLEDAREKRRLEAELNALTLEQKTMQLQMNPHFIFNALQAVRSHIHEDKLEDARASLTRFAKLMRTMLEMSRSDAISLEDEIEFLQAYIDVEKLIHHLPIDFEMHIDEEIEPYDIKVPPMLIQPVLENAIKYGGNGEEIAVRLSVSQKDGLLNICIEDNGKGFGSHVPVHKSASLEILKNRLMRMSQKARFMIGRSDLGGAKVEFDVPMHM